MTSTNNTDVLRQLFVAAINTSDKPGLVRLLTSRVSLGHLAAVLECDAEDYEVDAFEDGWKMVILSWLNTLQDALSQPGVARDYNPLPALKQGAPVIDMLLFLPFGVALNPSEWMRSTHACVTRNSFEPNNCARLHLTSALLARTFEIPQQQSCSSVKDRSVAFIPPLLRTTAGRRLFYTRPLLGGRISSPQALDSDAAMLLLDFVLRLSPVVIIFAEEMTLYSTAAPFHR